MCALTISLASISRWMRHTRIGGWWCEPRPELRHIRHEIFPLTLALWMRHTDLRQRRHLIIHLQDHALGAVFTTLWCPPYSRFCHKQASATPSLDRRGNCGDSLKQKTALARGFRSGDPGRTRTSNQLIKSQLLCQLSYGTARDDLPTSSRVGIIQDRRAESILFSRRSTAGRPRLPDWGRWWASGWATVLW